MDEILKSELKKEVKELNDILFLATESFKIVEFLAKNEEDADKRFIISRSEFFGYNMIVNWRVTVLELTKLLSGKKNDHYDLLRFIQKLKPGGKFGSANIDSKEFNNWESKISSEKGSIDNLVAQRDKLYAHSDRDASTIKNSVTVSKAKELLDVAQSVVREIYNTVFKSGFSFEAFNSPVNNLAAIINSLTNERKEKMEDLKKLALEHGITDEFK